MGMLRFRQECLDLNGKWKVHLTYKNRINGNKVKNAFAALFKRNAVAFA